MGATPHEFVVNGVLFYVDAHNEVSRSPECPAVLVRTTAGPFVARKFNTSRGDRDARREPLQQSPVMAERCITVLTCGIMESEALSVCGFLRA